MEYEISAEDINEDIVKLWKRTPWPDRSAVKVPLLFEGFHKGGLLTIGMNPSFSDGKEEVTKGGIYKLISKVINHNEGVKNSGLYNEKIEEYLKNLKDIFGEDFEGLKEEESRIDKVKEFIEKFVWKEQGYASKDALDIRKFDEIARLEYGFFKRFHELAQHLCKGTEWEKKWNHIDLFFYRETKQQNFLKDLKDKKFGEEFEKDSLGIVRKIIEKINPDIILVANSRASDIFLKEFKTERVDEEIGHYELKLSGKRVPVFLSGMVSSLDRWSFGRLKRQMMKFESKEAKTLL